jgi:hypothetical protein
MNSIAPAFAAILHMVARVFSARARFLIVVRAIVEQFRDAIPGYITGPAGNDDEAPRGLS